MLSIIFDVSSFSSSKSEIYVLSSEYDYVSASSSSFYNVNQYEYYNGVVHKRGLGFCGFSRIRTRQMVNVAQQNQVHDYLDVYYTPDKMGVIKKVSVRKALLPAPLLITRRPIPGTATLPPTEN